MVARSPLAYQTPAKLLHNGPALRLIADGNPALGKIGIDRGLAFQSIPGVNRALHWYQEFTFKAEYAYDYRMPQWLARLDHAFAPLHVERLFLGRHKFHHFCVWYRDELSRWFKGNGSRLGRAQQTLPSCEFFGKNRQSSYQWAAKLRL
jgi:asparagine synthase (glutamine-hydrolysing)